MNCRKRNKFIYFAWSPSLQLCIGTKRMNDAKQWKRKIKFASWDWHLMVICNFLLIIFLKGSFIETHLIYLTRFCCQLWSKEWIYENRTWSFSKRKKSLWEKFKTHLDVYNNINKFMSKWLIACQNHIHRQYIDMIDSKYSQLHIFSLIYSNDPQ